jgi:predicted Zn-dependent protease
MSGRLSVAVERGWEIRRGRRRRCLAPITLTGAALEVLESLVPAIGNDPRTEWRHGWCGKRGHVLPTGTEVPTLRFDAFTCV